MLQLFGLYRWHGRVLEHGVTLVNNCHQLSKFEGHSVLQLLVWVMAVICCFGGKWDHVIWVAKFP